MPLVRWSFFDPVEAVTYVVPLNPKDMTGPGYITRIGYQNTSGPGGRTIIYAGQDEVKEIEASGTLHTQDHYETFVEWQAKKRQVFLTDHLEREFWVYISEFRPTSAWAVNLPWRHTYTLKMTVLDWPD